MNSYFCSRVIKNGIKAKFILKQHKFKIYANGLCSTIYFIKIAWISEHLNIQWRLVYCLVRNRLFYTCLTVLKGQCKFSLLLMCTTFSIGTSLKGVMDSKFVSIVAWANCLPSKKLSWGCLKAAIFWGVSLSFDKIFLLQV